MATCQDDTGDWICADTVNGCYTTQPPGLWCTDFCGSDQTTGAVCQADVCPDTGRPRPSTRARP
jgi:hypothetical protein